MFKFLHKVHFFLNGFFIVLIHRKQFLSSLFKHLVELFYFQMQLIAISRARVRIKQLLILNFKYIKLLQKIFFYSLGLLPNACLFKLKLLDLLSQLCSIHGEILLHFKLKSNQVLLGGLKFFTQTLIIPQTLDQLLVFFLDFFHKIFTKLCCVHVLKQLVPFYGLFQLELKLLYLPLAVPSIFIELEHYFIVLLSEDLDLLENQVRLVLFCLQCMAHPSRNILTFFCCFGCKNSS